MNLMEGKHDSVAPALAWDEDAESYSQSLRALLGNLQGLGDEVVVGAGLARFSALRLAAIRHAAEHKVETHLQGLSAVLHVVTVAMRLLDDKLPPQVIADVTTHLKIQTQELACWRDLAGQAVYIGDHPDFARQLAQRYARQAEALGEWPKASVS